MLIFDVPISTDQSATVVLGASNFTQPGSLVGQSGVNGPTGLAFDLSGNLYVADLGNSRVLQFVPPFSSDMNASIVFGQSNFTSTTQSSSASGLDFPVGVATDANGDLWVADGIYNSRVLEFKPPFISGMTASIAIGQSSTGTVQGCNQGGVGSLCSESAMVFDAGGNLWVADTGNNRVLEYTAPFSTGMAATLELGHAAGANAFGAYQVNDGDGPAVPAAGTFWYPAGLAFDAHGDLWVTDEQNSRVMEFVPPFSNGMAATVVVGEPDFTSNSYVPTSQNSLWKPYGVAFDTSGNLLVADNGDDRMMVFTPPFSNGMNASMVLGQQNYTAIKCGSGSMTAMSICYPPAVATF